MKLILLLMLSSFLNCSESLIDSYDGDAFRLTTSEKTVAGTTYIIDTLFFKSEPVYKSTTADQSVGVRLSGNINLFVAMVDNKTAHLLVIGSSNGGAKLVLRLNGDMRYVPLKKDEIGEYASLLSTHFTRIYLDGNK
jgi:hypothetical protein